MVFQEIPFRNEYKPHLNIQCISINTLKHKKVIGSLTVRSIGQYCKTTDDIEKKYKYCKIL